MRTRSFNLLLILIPCILLAQSPERNDLHRLLREKQLTVVHRLAAADTSEGRESLTLNEETDEGLVWLNGISFRTGTIDVELKGQDVFQRSFIGIAFHGANDSTFEAVYFRPFHFRSDDPVRMQRRVQYISLPAHPWPVLREQFPGIFENSVEPAPDPDRWFRARIVVTETEVMVFVNDVAKPCLKVRSLSGRTEGKIGLYTADRSGGRFGGLTIRRDPQPK